MYKIISNISKHPIINCIQIVGLINIVFFVFQSLKESQMDKIRGLNDALEGWRRYCQKQSTFQ